MIGPYAMIVGFTLICAGDAFLWRSTDHSCSDVPVVVVRCGTSSAWEFVVLLHTTLGKMVGVKAAATNVACDQWDECDVMTPPGDVFTSEG